jgi:hypothetical protein
MRYVKWTFIVLIVGGFAAFLHYTLPQRDIVRITGTEIQRINVGWNGIFYANRMRNAQGELIGTDVRIINTRTQTERPRVYRNEDTGFWPPYFKFDSADLQTVAQDLLSTSAAPQWVVVRHYGWRSNLLSIYPNAVSIRPIDDPNVTLIPWFNIVFLTLLAAFFFWIWRKWVGFRERRIEPVLDDAAETWDRIDDRADAARGRIRRWWDGVTGKTPR